MSTEEDLETCINAVNPYHRVFVNSWDEDQVWISIAVSNGGANCTLTFDQARELISAINRIVGAP